MIRNVNSSFLPSRPNGTPRKGAFRTAIKTELGVLSPYAKQNWGDEVRVNQFVSVKNGRLLITPEDPTAETLFLA
jgi:hypothetical protein